MIKLWFSLLALIVASGAFADDSSYPEIKTAEGHSSVWLKSSYDSERLGDLEIIPPGSKFYHWNKPENFARWVSQGRVDSGEIEELKDGIGNVGGGFYVSSDFWDSNKYGNKLVVFTTTQNVTVLTNVDMGHHYWNELNKKLATLGIDGVGRYESRYDEYPNWFNFLNEKAFLNAKAGTYHDFEESDVIKSTDLGLAKILEINSRVPLQDTPWIRSNLPMISQIIHGSFDVSSLSEDDKSESINWLMKSSLLEDQSPLTKGARELFKSEVIERIEVSYRASLKTTRAKTRSLLASWGETGEALTSTLRTIRRLGLPYSTWLPEAAQPPTVFPLNGPSADPFVSHGNKPTHPYAQTLQQHLAYLDFDDFLNAIAQGTPIDKIYDAPGAVSYFTRWQQAKESNPYRQESALAINQALTGNTKSDYRDAPAASDGDIDWQGKKYFQVNDEQSQALKKNPFITPEFLTIADPRHSGKTIQIARYDYSTAANFEKFSDHLSDSLKEQLAAAKSAGKLSDPWAPEARAFTKQMLSELVNQIAADNFDLKEIDTYYALVSIHPFNEMNAETATALSVARTTAPKLLFKGNRTVPGRPDEALLMTRESINVQAVEDLVNLKVIQAAFARAESESPNFPKYYDVPEIWQVGRKIADIGPDAAAFVQESKAIYSTCVTRSMDAALNQGLKK